MYFRTLFRGGVAGVVALGGTIVFPLTASAAQADEYVVISTNGDVTVRTLTDAQAEKVADSPTVRIVSPEQEFSVSETPTEIVTGLTVPEEVADGEIIPGRYIVQFESTVASKVAANSLQENVVAMFSNAISGFVADLDPDDVIDLQTNPNVVSIEPDRVVQVEATQDNATWGLDRLDQRSLPLDRSYTYSNDGQGVTAYILDTGVYSAHSEFGSRVTNGFTAINDGRGTEDCHGHGTHVAGTVAGETYGVAKAATIVPVRVLSCKGSGSYSGVIAGIDWTIAHHQAGEPAVANMSLGGGYSFSVNAAVTRAIADGITYVVAAGNSNKSACSASPASVPLAITVGATSSNDVRASFSNWGTCVDLFAPGVSITSAMIGSPTEVRTYSGTSMASPHVAGVVALYLETHPEASPAEVTSTLLNAVTRGVVSNAGTGSPTSLLFAGSFEPSPPGVPSAPGSLRGVVGNESVTLSWSAPADGGSPISDYIVEYSSDNGATWVLFDDGVSVTRSATVAGLENNRPYLFRVSAENSVGQGSPSTTSALMPVVPGLPTAPRNLTATVGRERVNVYWSTPLSSGGASIIDYVIDISTDEGQTWTTFNDAVSTSRSALLSPLTAGVRHLIKVSAKNSGGVGPASNVVSVVPLSFDPPSIVRNLSGFARLEGAYLSWSTPSNTGGGTIQGYIVDWSTDGGETWIGSIRTSAYIRYASLSQLEGGVVHQFRVRGINQYGTGPDAIVSLTPTALSVPTAPRSPRVSVGYNSATLYWSTPMSNGGSSVNGYIVEYSTDNGDSWTTSSVQSSSRRYYSLTGLQGGVSHQFRVRAVNAVGVGSPSSVVVATPIAPTVPSAPRRMGGFVSGTTGYLSWSSTSSNGGASLTGYNVELSTDNGATWSLQAFTTSRSLRVANLVGGESTSFRVRAVNSVGQSSPSNVVTLQPRIAGAPNPPSRVSAVVDATNIVVSWSAVTSTYAPVTDYIVEYSVGSNSSWSTWNDGVSTATTATLTNMTPDVPVSIRIKAVNRYGISPASSVVTVTPRAAATAPSEPLNVTAVAGDTRATVRWSEPVDDGGAVVTSYVVTANPGGTTCQTGTLACVVTGLTNGVAYTFTVTATNSVGTSAASLVSNEVTPIAASLTPVAARSWGLDRTDQRQLPLDGYISRAGTAQQVDVYVIDTGVRPSHTDFTSRVVAGFSAIADGNGTNDCHGHGTHVAGTIAGASLGFGTQATIVPVRVLDCYGSGSSSGVIAGINWMIQRHVAGQPAVANLSLGGGFDYALNDAIDRAVADGITVVVAAGNESTDACTKSPASAASAITVGSTTSTDAKSYFSNIGACVDIFAPGSSIVSTGISSTTATAVMSGTSMAAPHVAGVAAIMLGNAPSLSPVQVTQRLDNDATRSVISGLSSSTVNALLHQTTTSGVLNGEIGEDDTVGQRRSVDGGSDSTEVDYGAELPPPTEVQNPNPGSGVSQPNVPVASPAAQVAITSVKKVGKFYRVKVSAPKGSRVTVYRNGRKVASGTKSVYKIRVTSAKKLKFHVKAKVNGAIVKSKVRTFAVK